VKQTSVNFSGLFSRLYVKTHDMRVTSLLHVISGWCLLPWKCPRVWIALLNHRRPHIYCISQWMFSLNMISLYLIHTTLQL